MDTILWELLAQEGELSDSQLLARLREHQQQRWRHGEKVRVEDYLERLPFLSAREELLLDLIFSEILLREKLGEQPKPEEYAQRFPRYGAQLARQFAVHEALTFSSLSQTALGPPEVSASFTGQSGTLDAARRSTSTAPRTPACPLVPGYEILDEGRRGGMGVVYKAQQTSLNRLVALKMILAGPHSSPQDLARFRREAETAAELEHPNIVRIYEVGQCDGRPYLTFEWVDGVSLKDRISGVPQPPAWAAQLTETLARAIHEAHQRGIIHRDLKPGNVLFTARGVPKITDFGLARRVQEESFLTESGAILGTPNYMPPEQAAGTLHAIGPASDVYALGAILYELLSGHPPFQGATAVQTIEQVRFSEPVSLRRLLPKLPRDLDTICLKCLEKDPNQRYASAQALAEDLRRFRDGQPIEARPAGVMEHAWKWARRRPAVAALVGVSAVAAIALVTIGAGLVYQAELQRAYEGVDKQKTLAEAARDQALLAKQNEASARQEEETQRQRAQAERAEADRQRDRAERILYAAQMNLAERAWRDAHLPRMHRLLNEQRPENTGKRDLRGFEWYYLARLTRASLLTLPLANNGPKRFGLGPNTVAFSADGAHLAAVDNLREVAVWNAATGEKEYALRGHPEVITGLAFAPDGATLASGDQGGTVKIWDLVAKKELRTWRERGTVSSVVYSPDGSRFATAASTGEIKIWDAATGRELHNYRSNGSWVRLAYDPDGAWLVVAGTDISMWNPVTGEIRALPGRRAHVLCLAISPKRPKPDRDKRGAAPTDQSDAEPSFTLAAGEHTGTIAILDPVTGKSIRLLHGHTDEVRSVAFNRDGTRLSTRLVSGGRDGTVRVWDIDNGSEVTNLRGHSEGIYSVAFHPGGWRVASASYDNTVKLWDGSRSQEGPTCYGHQSTVRTVAFSPDSRQLASGGVDGTVKLWDVGAVRRTGDTVAKRTFRGHQGIVASVAFDRAGDRLASASHDHTVKIWDVSTGQDTLTLTGHSAIVTCVAFSPDGKCLASAGWDQSLRIWDAASGQEIHRRADHGQRVSSVAYSPDGRYLASASGEGTVRLAAAGSGEVLRAFGGFAEAVHTVAFSPDGRYLAAAGRDGFIQLWEVANGKEERTFQGDADSIASIAFTPDGRRLMSASSYKFVRIWDVATGQEILALRNHLRGYPSEVEAVAVSPDGQCLASSGGTLKMWYAPPER